MRSLKSLRLHNLTTDSLPSKLFAKYSSWCEVRELNLFGFKTEERSILALAYFVWQVISICIHPERLSLRCFEDCYVQLFALRQRRRIEREVQDNRQKKLEVTIGTSRVSVKQLMCEIMKAPVGNSVATVLGISGKFRQWFTPSEIQFWNEITRQ